MLQSPLAGDVMKLIFLALIFNFSISMAQAQDYNLKSLYSQEALVTARFLPFKVYDKNQTAAPILKVHVYGPCESLVDNNRSEVFHIYCVDEAEVDLIIKLQNGMIIAANDIAIKKQTIIDPNIELPNNDSLGKKLFTDNCLECHRTQPITGVQTAASLRSALNRSPMLERGLGVLLNDDDEKINALIEYINGGE